MPTLPEAFLRLPIAHRAFHDQAAGRPENSLIAARAAIEAGYGIEIDIQPSSDGVPMVFHDYTLARLTGAEGRIADRTAAELGALTLKGGAEGIPTLAQMLETVAGRVPLLIEIKDQDGHCGPGVGPLEAAVAQVLSGYQGPVAVMSFNPYSMAAMARVAPQIPRGITSCSFPAKDWPMPADRRAELAEIPDYEPTGCSFISHEAANLARPRVAALKTAGAAILCWTIRSPEAEAEARKIADNITFERYAAVIPS